MKFKMMGSGIERSSAPDTKIDYRNVDLQYSKLVGQAIDDYTDTDLDFYSQPDAVPVRFEHTKKQEKIV